MRKHITLKIFLFFFAFMTSWQASSQTQLFSELFENEIPPNWEIYSEIGSSQIWEFETKESHSGPFFTGRRNLNEDWLISPEIILEANMVESISLTFDLIYKYGPDDINKLEILVSEDYNGEVSSATWTSVWLSNSSNIPDHANNWQDPMESVGPINLGAFKNKSVYIAIKVQVTGTNDASRQWLINNFVVEAVPINASPVPYSESFLMGTLCDWVSFSEEGDDQVWEYNSKYTNKGAFFAGRKIGNLDWLISPPIDLAVDLDIKIEMAFDLIYRYGVNQSNLLEIMISEDFQGDMDKSNWTSIWISDPSNLPDAANSWNEPMSNIASIDLSRHRNKTVNIAFRAFSDGTTNGSRQWLINNFSIEKVYTLPLFEQFSVDNFDNWEIQNQEGPGQSWNFNTLESNEGAYFAGSRTYNEDWLISPKVEVSSFFDQNIVIAFDLLHRYGDDNSNELEILVAEDYSGDIASSTWNSIWSSNNNNLPPTATHWDDPMNAIGPIDLTNYANKKLHIAFRVVTDGSDQANRQWLINNIHIEDREPSIQELPYNKTFESALDWYIYNEENNAQSWVHSGLNSDNHGAFFAGEQNSNNDWLISSPIDLSAIENEKLEMTFELMYRYGASQSNQLEILVSEDFAGNMSTAMWQPIWNSDESNLPAAATSWNDPMSQIGPIDLNNYKNKIVYFAIKASADGTSNASRQWLLNYIDIYSVRTLPMTETFSSGTLGDWLISGDDVSGNWDYANYGTNVGAMFSDNTGFGEGWLVSPPIDLAAGLDEKINMSFDLLYQGGEDDINALEVLVSDNFSGDIDLADWNLVWESKDGSLPPATETWSTGMNNVSSIDLNAFRNKKINVAIKATNANGQSRQWMIGNVEIERNPISREQLPLTQAFSFRIPENWTVINQVGDQEQWQHATKNVHSGAFFAGEQTENEDWLISPAIELAADFDEKINMSFNLIHRYGNNRSNNLEVLVSEDYFVGNLNTATWQTVWLSDNSYDEEDEGWKIEMHPIGPIDLASFKGKLVNIAIKATTEGSSNGSRQWLLNDFVVELTDNPAKLLPYAEDFLSGLSHDWEVHNELGESDLWEYNTWGNYTGAHFSSQQDINVDWLISPQIDLTAGSNNVDLTFDLVYNNASSVSGQLELLVSGDYTGDTQTASWETVWISVDEILPPITGSESENIVAVGPIRLNAFRNDNVHVAIKASTAGSQAEWLINNFSINSNAIQLENLPYSEDFQSANGIPASWVVIDLAGESGDWDDIDVSGNLLAQFRSSGGQNEDWLVSPQINLKRSSQKTALIFDFMYLGGDDQSNKLEVLISSKFDGVSVGSQANWNSIWSSDQNTLPGESTGWSDHMNSSGFINLESHEGKKVWLAFRATSDDNTGFNDREWRIDNINVSEHPDLPLYSKVFQSESSIDWTSISEEGSDQTWEYKSLGTGIDFKDGMCFAGQKVLNEDWLISPSIDLTAVSNIELIFDLYYNYGTNQANLLEVFISEDYQGTLSNSSWEILWSSDDVDISNNYQRLAAIDPINLNSFRNKTVNIAFKSSADGSQNDSRQWLINNFVIGDNPYTAENLPFHEDFSDGTLGSFTAYNEEGPAQFWQYEALGSNANQNEGVFFAGKSEANIDWLISPLIDLAAGFDESIEMTFDMIYRYGDIKYNTLEVLVSEDYLDVPNARWQSVWHSTNSNIPSMASDWNEAMQRVSGIDLSDYKNKKVSVAIKATAADGSGSRQWLIDNIEIGARPLPVQSLPFSEDFSIGSLDNWSTYSAAGDDQFWEYNDANGLEVAFFAGRKENNEDWLISPIIDLTTALNAELSFDINYRFGIEPHSTLEVYVSTNYPGGGNPNAFFSEKLPLILPSEAKSWSDPMSSSGQIDLTQFSGNKIYLAFKTTSAQNDNGSRQYRIDNILINEYLPALPLPVFIDFGADMGELTALQIAGNELVEHSPDEGIISFDSKGNLNENWLIFPRMDLGTVPMAMLSFDLLRFGINATDDDLRILVSTSYTGTGDPTGFFEEELNFSMPDISSSWDAPLTTVVVNLQSYVESKVSLAFRFSSDQGQQTAMKIDNVRLDQMITPNYKYSFDKNFQGWTSVGPNANHWVYDNHEYVRYNSNGQAGDYAVLVSPTINLTGLSDAYLEFSSAYDGTGNDELRLEITDDWVHFTPLDFTLPNKGNLTWTNSGVIDLSAYKGKVVQLFFEVASAETSNMTYYLDDINIQYNGDPHILEDNVPQSWSTTAGMLSMSTDHYKKGDESLRWDWLPNSIIEVTDLGNIDYALSEQRGGMVLWIYNEDALSQNDSLIFQFESAQQVEYEFSFRLGFEGWRACYVRFDEDMWGPKASDDIVAMKILAPDMITGGSLFFDRFSFGAFGKSEVFDANSNRLMHDYQMPFIKTSETSVYEQLYRYSLKVPDIPLYSVIGNTFQHFEFVEEKLEDLIFDIPSDNELLLAHEVFNSLQIERNGNQITGAPIFSTQDQVVEPLSMAYEPAAVSLGDIDNIILPLAIEAYFEGDDTKVQNVLNLLAHLIDQGFAYGSSTGTIHHHGYSFQNIANACFVMKRYITAQDEEYYNKVMGMLEWFAEVGMLWDYPFEHAGDNLDRMNVNLVPKLIYYLLQDDQRETQRGLAGLGRWMNNALDFAPGTRGTIKPDYSSFHHNGLYPAYARDGYEEMTRVVYSLSQSLFAIEREKHENLRQALYAFNIFSNYSWGFAICGRHPFSDGGDTMKDHYYNMALTGTPDGSLEIDPLMAGAYKRQWGETPKFADIQEEPIPNGNWTMNYAALNLHRAGEWLALIKGMNKHVWGSEIYATENRYGRYYGYGSVQLLNSNGNKASGFVEDGWDWNRIPGTTIIHRPLNKLEAPWNKGLTAKSVEAFAGGLSFKNQYGAFGMILHEIDQNENYDPTFMARKSVFSFDDRIICLGSNIENSTSEFATETVLFQGYLPQENTPIFINNVVEKTIFPYQWEISSNLDSWLLDAYGTGYYVPGGQSIRVDRSEQTSKHSDTKQTTKNNYSSAVIDHGFAPDQGEYEYAILMGTDAHGIQAFHTAMSNPDNALYTVLQKDNRAHIVKDEPSQTFGYVIFEDDNPIDHGDLMEVDYPCIVMIQNTGSGLSMALVNPDLNLPENGQDDSDDYHTNGESQLRRIRATIAGEWSIGSDGGQTDNYRIVRSSSNSTEIEFDIKDGLGVEVNLVPAGISSAREAQVKPAEDVEKVEQWVNIYPNPVKDILSVQLKPEYTDGQVDLLMTNLSGQKVLQQVTINSDASNVELNTSLLPEGIYLLNVSHPEYGRLIKKVIKN